MNNITQNTQLPLAALMRSMEERDVALTAEGDQLRFRAPKGALTASDKQALASRRTEVVRYVHALKASKRPPFEGHSHNPTPSVTQRLWWQGMRAAGSRPSDCLRLTIPFSGVDACTAEAAIRRVIGRHDALRYRLIDANGTLTAAVNTAEELFIETRFIAAQPADLQAALHSAIAEFESTTIPVEATWLTVAKLLMTGEHDGVIALSVHHIIADAASLLIIKNELDAALLPGAQQAACDAPIQFSQYAAWEADWFQGEAACSLGAYWASWLEDLPTLPLPQTAAPQGGIQGRCTAYLWVCGSAGVAKVHELAVRCSATPFVVLVSIFAIAVCRWSGQSRFGLLSVADGRTYGEPAGLDSMVGPMVYMDPIEVNVRGEVSLPAVLPDIFNSYDCARRFRFPLNDFQPGITERDFHHRIAVSINYVRLSGGSELISLPPAHSTSEVTAHGVTVSHGLLGVQAKHYLQAAQPINLRVVHQDHNLWGVLEFNEAAMPVQAQSAFVAVFVEALKDAFDLTCGKGCD